MKNKKATKKPAKTQAKAAPSKKPAPPLQVSQENAFGRTVHGIFQRVQAKTGLSDEKLDKFQAGWLAMPKTRREYKHLADAPMVAIEEGLAMANDIVDFLQSQKGGQSLVFEKLKGELSELVHHPFSFLKTKWEAAETLAKNVAHKIQEEAAKAKQKNQKK